MLPSSPRSNRPRAETGPARALTGRGQPIVFAPSRASRMMSAWPACWAVSAMMWTSARRAVQRAPGGNQGASGSGCEASRSTSATSSSVRAAISAYADSRPASVSPGSIRKESACSAIADSVISIAAGPRRMKSTQPRSQKLTCLISPASVSSLTVVRPVADSSSSPSTVCRRKNRCLARVSSRSARSPAWGSPAATVADAVVALYSSMLVICVAPSGWVPAV
jgi:hypothetical protein